MPIANIHTGPPISTVRTALQVRGALALELKGDAAVERDRLSQAGAGSLAALMARDLADVAADAARLQLVTVGAHYDPIEALRPGWPLHRQLERLAERAPGTAIGRIVAFGAHDGRLPDTLAPSPEFAGGPLRLVPFVLAGAPAGDADTVARVAAQLEAQLLERGRAGADTALAAQDAFGVQIEHARYLTMHDLTAMIAMQYDHASLALLWPLLETALLQPDAEEWLDAAPEPLLHYVDGEARIALFSPQAWHQRYAGDVPCDTDESRELLSRRHQHFEARQRQYAAVLAAHGVPVNFVHCERGVDCRLALS